MKPFVFFDPGRLRDGDLTLTLHETVPAFAGRAPCYRFHMRRGAELQKIGRIELRLANTTEILLYAGHIGYNVDQSHRGHRFAARATTLLYPLARQHGFTEIWITCDPDNLPSKRTCELVGGEFISEVPVPEDHPFFKAGSTAKLRYRVKLD